MRLRNNIFAAALDFLKRNNKVKTQKQLAELMGVSEDTITRILKDRCEVTEDIITKLQTASGCIFNLQWLRGEDAIHMLATDLESDRMDVAAENEPQPFIPSWADAFFDIMTQQIKQNEALNNELRQSIAEMREITKQLSLLIETLHR
jgi:plasmid maintenance system antidote protein VapI